MDKKQSARKGLQEAWNRFLDNTYTGEDLSLILDSLREDGNFQEFHEVSDRVWSMSMTDTLPESEEQKEIYRREAAQLLAEYSNRRKIRPVRNTGRFRKIWYAAAAALLLGLLIPAAYLYMKPKSEQQAVQYVEESTARGEIKTIFLSDQTKVTLNAESRMKYPAEFYGNERSVELQGEALFEVTADPGRPFTVKTESMEIKVLGTVFDVKEYTDDLFSTVSVASGKVEVDLAGGTVDTWHATSIFLEKDQQVRMDRITGNFEKLTIDAGKYLSWKDGTLYFHRTPVREVVNILNRYYPQINVELAEGEYSSLISGEHDNKRPEAVLTSIVYSTGLRCKKAENKFILYQK